MKGMRVFPPYEHEPLAQILHGWSDAAHAYGFQQYKTSVLESLDLYADKTSEEIMQEQTYQFTDRGGRDVLLRPEITPGVSAMIVDLQNKRMLKTPCKVFSIGSVFRYENPQKGRTREHIQFNVDLFGDSDIWADAEVIEVAFAALESIGFARDDFIVRLNNRRSVEQALTELGLQNEVLREVMRLLDKRDKMEAGEFNDRLSAHTITTVALDDALREAPKQVRDVIDLLPNVTAEYDPNIIRGFDYYTDTVFEIYTRNDTIASRSVAGGGRYDNLIESYGGTPLSAVGFGMGDVVLMDCMEALKLETKRTTPAVALCVTEERDVPKGVRAAADLRARLPVSFIGVVPQKKMSDVYKHQEQVGAQYVVGIEDGSFTVRTLSTRTTDTFPAIDDVLRAITT